MNHTRNLDWWRGYLAALRDVQEDQAYVLSKGINRIEKIVEEEEAKNVAV